MITKCMTCGTVLRVTSDLPLGAVSHGYCGECARVVMRQWAKKLEEEAIDGSEGQDSSSH